MNVAHKSRSGASIKKFGGGRGVCSNNWLQSFKIDSTVYT